MSYLLVLQCLDLPYFAQGWPCNCNTATRYNDGKMCCDNRLGRGGCHSKRNGTCESHRIEKTGCSFCEGNPNDLPCCVVNSIETTCEAESTNKSCSNIGGIFQDWSGSTECKI